MDTKAFTFITQRQKWEAWLCECRHGVHRSQTKGHWQLWVHRTVRDMKHKKQLLIFWSSTKKAKPSKSESDSDFGNRDKNRFTVSPPPTGFRSGWQCPKAAVSSTVDVDSDTEDTAAKSGELAQVDWIDYAADDSKDNTNEATSMSIRKPTKNNGPSNVCLTKSYYNQY